jgi:hypothetical protein
MTTRPKAMNAMTSPASHAKPASRSVFEKWGRTAYRRRRLILLIALLVDGAGRRAGDVPADVPGVRIAGPAGAGDRDEHFCH